MKYNLTMEFNSLEELNSFVDCLNNNSVVRLVADPRDVAAALDQAGYQSLADIKLHEEAPTLPPVTPEPAEFNMSRDEVKTFCTVARTEKGVNIKQILQNLGVGSFKELPDDKLEALYDAVKSARGD